MHESQFLPSRFAQHKLVILITGTITISIALVAVALWLYASSGAELLDLSRPGYQDVSKSLVSEETKAVEFPSTGPINQETISSFQALYAENTKKVTSGEPFGGDPLNPETLGVGAPPESAQ